MEEPPKEIEHVIRMLTQTPPSVQQRAINQYFVPHASFTHPFCRTGSFYWSESLNSRQLLHGIYRWYKIMSPRIDLEVNSIAYDCGSLILYVNISQKFRIWIVPFFEAPVNLVTVLHLVHDKQARTYKILSQNDLYQVNEFVRFFWLGGWIVVWLWQFTAALFCGLGACLLWPQTWIAENLMREGWTGLAN